MFGLSTWEILIILVVALIFVGPDQLPKVARTIGKGMRQVRGAMGKVDDEVRKVVREASAELDDDGRPVTRDVHHAPAERRSPGHGRTMDYPEPLSDVPPTADGHDGTHERHPDHPGPEHHARDLDQSVGVEPGPVPPPASSALTANAKPTDVSMRFDTTKDETHGDRSDRSGEPSRPSLGSGAVARADVSTERDWSQVGRAPVAGQVAQTPRPPITPPSPPVPVATNDTAPDQPPTQATEPTKT